MKKFLAVVAMGIALTGLSACASEEPLTQDDLFTTYNVNVNGQSVPCIVYDDGNYGSELTCNWGVYK